MRPPSPSLIVQTRLVLVVYTALLGLCAATLGCGPPSTAEGPPPKQCRQTLAAFDIGSATTKLQIAEIDTCQHRIVERLARAARHVPYGEDVGQYGRIQPTTVDAGVHALMEMSQFALLHDPDAKLAVATEAFRRAGNAEEVIARLNRDVGLNVSVISQQREAKLAFWGALMIRPEEPSRAVVWDIGGESMQLTGLQDDKVMIHGIDFGTNDMHRFLAEKVQRKTPGSSPNPASSKDASAGHRFARDRVMNRLPIWLQVRLAAEQPLVIGVGAIRYYTDPNSQRSWCTNNALGQALSGSLERTDADIGGAYAAARVPALTLIRGGMDALGIERVEVADIDLTDGLLATHAP